MKNKINIYLIGFMAAGKSAVARLLNKKLYPDYLHVDSDEYIEKLKNCSIAEIFKQFGEDYFRGIEVQAIDHLIQTHSRQLILSTGGGSVLAESTQKKLKGTGIVVYLFCEIDQILQRLIEQQKEQPLKRPLGIDQHHVRKIFSERKKVYEQLSDITICNTSYQAEKTVIQVDRMIKKYLSSSG